MGHKPALRFSSRRASAFQRPWMASGSSKGVRARQPLYHGADSSARIDANGRRSRCPQPGRTAPRTTAGAPLISASEYDPNPLPSRARRYPVFSVEIHCQKQNFVVKMGNLQAAIFKQNR